MTAVLAGLAVASVIFYEPLIQILFPPRQPLLFPKIDNRAKSLNEILQDIKNMPQSQETHPECETHAQLLTFSVKMRDLESFYDHSPNHPEFEIMVFRNPYLESCVRCVEIYPDTDDPTARQAMEEHIMHWLNKWYREYVVTHQPYDRYGNLCVTGSVDITGKLAVEDAVWFKHGHYPAYRTRQWKVVEPELRLYSLSAAKTWGR